MLLDKSTSGTDTLQATCQASCRAQDDQGASLSVTNFPYKFAAAVVVTLQT